MNETKGELDTQKVMLIPNISVTSKDDMIIFYAEDGEVNNLSKECHLDMIAHRKLTIIHLKEEQEPEATESDEENEN